MMKMTMRIVKTLCYTAFAKKKNTGNKHIKFSQMYKSLDVKIVLKLTGNAHF